MPRSLSGVRSGEFDTIEVTEKMTAQDLETTGRFQHTADDANLPAEFSYLNIGETGDTGVRLKVFGNLEVTGATTTSGLEAALTFKASDGTVLETYDGGLTKDFDNFQLPAPTAPSTLTFKASDGTVLETYDGGLTKDFQLPAPTTPSTLTLKQGTATLGTYSTTDTTITVPTPIVATLTHGNTQTIDIDDNPSLVYSGYGLTLTNLPSNTKVKVDVQMWVDNTTSTKEEVFVALTTSKTSFSTNYTREVVFVLQPNTQKLATYSKVLTLSGTCDIGLAVDTKDPETGVFIKLGGGFPDVIMSATEVDHSSTQYAGGGG
jgi:hypothetical protein